MLESVGFEGALAASTLVEVITAELYRLEGFDAQFREMVEQATRGSPLDIPPQLEKLHQREESLAKQRENLVAAIAEYGPQDMFRDKVAELDSLGCELRSARRDLQRRENEKLVLPASVAQLRQLTVAKFKELATHSYEFGKLMRQLVPEFYVYLVRLCDGRHLMPRAKVRLDLAGIIPNAKSIMPADNMLKMELTLDLFEPPQRERIRETVVHLASTGMRQYEIINHLPEKVTLPAIQNALALDRLMREQGLVTPYVVVLEPPPDCSKLRRHINPKYAFNMSDGYVPMAL